MHLAWVFFYLHFSLEIQKSAMALPMRAAIGTSGATKL